MIDGELPEGPTSKYGYCPRCKYELRAGEKKVCSECRAAAVCPVCKSDHVLKENEWWAVCSKACSLKGERLDYREADEWARDEVTRRKRKASAAPRPRIRTLAERLAVPRRSQEWRVQGLQQIGHRVILSAKYKRGKTSALGNLNRSLLDDERLFDHFEISPVAGTIWLFDLEMAEEDRGQLDDWYEELGIRNADRLVIVPLRGCATAFDILTPEGRAWWAAAMRERNAQYAELDCLRPALDASGLDEQHEAGAYLAAFDALLKEANVHEAVVTHHFGHTQERGRGDSRILDWPDVNWKLTTKTEDPAAERWFSAFGRGVEVHESCLQFDPSTHRLSVTASQDSGGRPRDIIKEATLAVLPEWPAKKSVRQLVPAVQARANAGSYRTISKACHELKIEQRAEVAEGRIKGSEVWGRPRVPAVVGSLQVDLPEGGPAL
jgi:hypothetical protein